MTDASDRRRRLTGLLLGLAGLAAFFWAIRSRQFDDLDGAALRILNDDGPKPPPEP
jgi:cbb3-type cytochrome oxidase maturation protein